MKPRWPFKGAPSDPPQCDASHESAHDAPHSSTHAPSPPPDPMTTPRVTELPRRLEPTSLDTFLGDPSPLARVVPLHSRDRDRDSRPRPRGRHNGRNVRPMGDPGPGGDAA